jgi:peroxiredoxin family protein
MQRQMERIDIPPIPEFIELVADSGVRLYACKASVDMFGLTMEDFVPQVEDIISVALRIASSPKKVKKRSAAIPSMRAPLAMIKLG